MCMYVDIPLVILAVTSRLTLQSFWMLNDTLSDRRPMVGSRNGTANRRPSAAPPRGRCNWVPTVPSDGDEEGNWSSEATCYPHYYIVCCQKNMNSGRSVSWNLSSQTSLTKKWAKPFRFRTRLLKCQGCEKAPFKCHTSSVNQPILWEKDHLSMWHNSE
jgi:hypothetical protein